MAKKSCLREKWKLKNFSLNFVWRWRKEDHHGKSNEEIFKLNVEGNSFDNSGGARIGGIICDNHKRWISSFSNGIKMSETAD